MAIKQLWQWDGLDAQGRHHQGTCWEESRNAVMLHLLQQHIQPLTLRRRPVRQRLWRGEYSCEIIHQLATLLQAGLALPESLLLLAKQQPSPQWQALLEALAQELERGETFCAALGRWPEVFPPLYLTMVRTGELTGQLDACCFSLAEQQKTQLALASKVKKALRYPLIILGLAFVVVLAMVYLVLPEFAKIYQTFNTPLPALTRGVIASAELIRHGSAPLLLFIAAIALLFVRLKKNVAWQKQLQKMLLACPLAGPLIRGQTLSQIFTVLALTQRSGIAFLHGLESVKETLSCPWWQEIISKVHQQIAQGQAISAALQASGVFTPLCVQLVSTGEASGALDAMLLNLARHHHQRTHQQADGLASMLEPLLLVVTGVIIGTLVVAMYLPIFHLGDAMSGAG